MVKNAPNKLKFGPDMYFYEFYRIPEDFWKIFKIGRFLAEKWALKRVLRVAISKLFFRRKLYQGLQKCPDLAENQCTCCLLCV